MTKLTARACIWRKPKIHPNLKKHCFYMLLIATSYSTSDLAGATCAFKLWPSTRERPVKAQRLVMAVAENSGISYRQMACEKGILQIRNTAVLKQYF